MPTTQMCAECDRRACDCTAVVFKRCQPAPEFSQARTEILGQYCEAAAWRQVFHALRTRGPEYSGGEVRRR